jgi:hypothetical protein
MFIRSACHVVSSLHEVGEIRYSDPAYQLPATSFWRLFNDIHAGGNTSQILDWIALELTHEYYSQRSVQFIVRHVGYILAEGNFSNYNLRAAMSRLGNRVARAA